MIAADVRWPHQKSSLLGPSLPARRLVFCSSHKAGGGLWSLSLSPPTSPGRSAGDRIQTTEGGEWGGGGVGRHKSKQNHESSVGDSDFQILIYFALDVT